MSLPEHTKRSDVEVGEDEPDSEELLSSALRGRLGLDGTHPLSLAEWQKLVADFMKKERLTYTDLGRQLLVLLGGLDTPGAVYEEVQ